MAQSYDRRINLYVNVDGKEVVNSVKAIRGEMQHMINAQAKMTIGSAEYVKEGKKIEQLKGILSEHRAGVTSLAGTLQNIPGPAGSVVSSLMGVGKAMWALVANPIGATIALIVGGLTLLYKAFTATDTGAVAMEGTLKAIGNVMDILIDRAMSYYKMLWSLVTFDWEGVKKNAKDAFGGLAGQIKDATSAGWDYAQTMDAISDREAAAQTRMAKMRAEIELLKNQSKDVNKTTKEKSDLIDQAMAKEITLNGIEKGFMKERTIAETKNLASKINNSKLTMEQKEAQLNQWLATDDKELASMTQKDAAFAEFVNKNEEGFQALQKMKADEFQKDADFQTETRRLQKSAASEKKALRDEEKAAIEEAQKEALEQLDITNNELTANLIAQYNSEKLTDSQFKLEMIAAEYAYLALKRNMLVSFGQSTVNVDKEINQKQADAKTKANAELLNIQENFNTINDELTKSADEDLQNRLDEDFKSAIDKNDKNADNEAKILEKRKQNYLDLAAVIGQSFGDLLNDQEASAADYLKATLLMALEALHQWMLIEEGKVMLSGIAKGGIVGVGLAVVKIAAMEIAYNAIKGALSKSTTKHAAGGFTNGEATYIAGEKGKEYIAPNWQVTNPITGPMIAQLENWRRNPVSVSSGALEITKQFSNSTFSNLNTTPKTKTGEIILQTTSDPELKRVLAENTKAINNLLQWKPKVTTELIKKDLKTLETIEKNRGL